MVVNLAGEPAQARVTLPWNDLAGRDWELTDRLDDQRFERDGETLASRACTSGSTGWGSHFFTFAPVRRFAESR